MSDVTIRIPGKVAWKIQGIAERTGMSFADLVYAGVRFATRLDEPIDSLRVPDAVMAEILCVSIGTVKARRLKKRLPAVRFVRDDWPEMNLPIPERRVALLERLGVSGA